MKILSLFSDYTSHISNTIFRMYQHPYSSEWSEALCVLLDWADDGECIVDQHTVTIGPYSIWISNKWYAYGSLYSINGKLISVDTMRRPSFKVMRRLDQLVKK